MLYETCFARLDDPFAETFSAEEQTVGEQIENLREKALIIELAAKGRLDWSPKKNWVENAGGLPKYIEDIAVALIRDHGYTRERAIATAVNRVKKWAAGGDDVKADTKAKAAKALAEWEKLKAKSHTKKG